jgi:hypothetical protein
VISYETTRDFEGVSKMQKWRVSPVQTVAGGSGGFSGHGFFLHDEFGRPCVTFGYLTERDAEAGREHLQEVLANAKSVVRVPS